jgi:DNA-binding transcriptional LysR family regulator
MNLSQLRAVVAVADRQNFSEAASALSVNQSTVSHAIASLEDELGVPLFVRGRRGATPTPAGAQIADYARQVLQLLELIEREANLHKSCRGGHIRIAAFRSVATHVLPTVVAQFRQRFPEVTVSIVDCPDEVRTEQLLRDGRADLGFTYLPTDPEFAAWEILRDPYLVLLPPTMTLAADRLTWEELATLPLILPSAEPTCDLGLHNHLKAHAQHLNIVYTINQDSALVSMVMQGLGVGILPRLAAEPIPASIQVQSLPVPYERVIEVIMLSTALHVPAVFAFLDLLKQVYQSAPVSVSSAIASA